MESQAVDLFVSSQFNNFSEDWKDICRKAQDKTRMSSKTSKIQIAMLLIASTSAIFFVLTATASNQNDLKPTVSQNTSQSQSIDGRSPEALDQTNDEQQQSISSTKDRKQSNRGGRMLDLDHLAGVIGKDEKMAKERSLSGDRQSRILSEDILPQQPTAARSIYGKKPKSKKKMAIKGFIPIVSLEHAKDGKHAFENPLDDSDEDEEPENESQNAQGNTKEQLMANYGSQTSVGHASFGVQPDPVQQHQQEQSANSYQWQQMLANSNQQSDSQDIARARRLLGSNGLLSSLTSPGKRFVSSLVPQQSQQVLGPMPIQGPMNLPMQMLAQQQQQQFHSTDPDDCICVPFFQCKNGYLSESQLSKGQLSQMFNQQQQHQSQQTPYTFGHQIPRALNYNSQQQAAPDLSNSIANSQQQQQQISANFIARLSPEQRRQLTNQLAGQQQAATDNQQMNELIYEQLKKSIENSNLEQQLIQQQQQQNAYLLDERSKTGNKQTESNATSQADNNSSNEENQERSLLNSLGKRQSGQTKCGIMRTCCKVPQSMLPNQQQQYPARFGSLPQQHQQLMPAHNARLVTSPVPLRVPQPQSQPQYQILHPNSQLQSLVNHQFANDLVSNNNNRDHQPAASLALPTQHQPVISKPLGTSFMVGRCGSRQTLGISGRVQNSQPGSETTAEFGEFPAHVAILKRLSPGDSMFVCSASLISNQWIVTAAHCIKKHKIGELKIRLGEWDVNRDDEFYPFMESNIREIIVHPDFQPTSLINDIALIRLETPVDPQQMPHISPACLPNPEESFNQQRCWVTGWGKDAFGQQGTFQSVLKKVDLPVVGHQDCENALRYQTRLGKFFRLHQSAICAGGERGKDACEGDGGAGLYCADADSGSIKVIGLVSWGVGCGQRGVPGVYTNLAYLSPWIEQIVATSGEENLYSDRSSMDNSAFKSIISERSNNGTATIEPVSTSAAANNSTLPQKVDDLESRSI